VLPPEQARRLYELVQKESLSDPEEVLELARIAVTFCRSQNDELPSDKPIQPEELLEIWSAAEGESDDLEDFGTLNSGTSDGPRAAGLGSYCRKLDPRSLVRGFTVYQMKDRAGTVGTHGVGPLLRDLLAGSGARVHLIGHSYGGKVVLSATCWSGDLPRQVESMLLLQPAVSHLCFADNLPKVHCPGGYRTALERVRKPILTTFSEHDFPLTKTFHLALRRKDDLGEVRIAAPGSPPSKYAALGGFGPRSCGEMLIDIHDVNQPYTLDPQKKIYGLDGSRTISGHGDISNESTWWALYSLVTA